ncbi:chlorinating enzyme [Streptomyces sp. NPDC002766]|jgi:non-heme Fe2+,alpha-ketoglutarate-dependent halogenase|uniref:chlorinating enzyme n=1 Tax=unclassified Streptomyces TaxID=2593676 RepID=UPI003329F578
MTISQETDFRLSAEELARFERDGFIGPIKIFEPEEMTERWNNIRRRLPDRSLAIYPDDALSSGTNISNYDRHLDVDLLSEHIMNRRIVDRVASILGPDVLCWRTEFFPKYPGDEGTDWHQAATFANASKKPQIMWPAEDSEIPFGGTITVWTAFTDSTKENGCLQLMPGTHREMNYDESKAMDYDPDAINSREKEGVKRGFFGYDYRQLQKDPNWKPDESQAFPLVMKRGECVIFWSTLMHASLPHTGSRKDYRMGFAARYVPTKVKIYPDTDQVAEYGGGIALDNYGAVLVSGEDTYGINTIATHSRRGYAFTPRRW